MTVAIRDVHGYTALGGVDSQSSLRSGIALRSRRVRAGIVGDRPTNDEDGVRDSHASDSMVDGISPNGRHSLRGWITSTIHTPRNHTLLLLRGLDERTRDVTMTVAIRNTGTGGRSGVHGYIPLYIPLSSARCRSMQARDRSQPSCDARLDHRRCSASRAGDLSEVHPAALAVEPQVLLDPAHRRLALRARGLRSAVRGLLFLRRRK